MKVGIICGYGSKLDEGTRQYVESVMKYVLSNKIQTLILSGGFTSRESNTSEARLMLSLMEQQSQDVELLLEEKSLTTLHNLLYAKEIIERLKLSEYEVCIFCDQVRYLKIYILSKVIFKNSQNIQVIKISRKEYFTAYILQIISIIYQLLGAINPSIEKKIFLARKRWIEKKSNLK